MPEITPSSEQILDQPRKNDILDQQTFIKSLSYYTSMAAFSSIGLQLLYFRDLLTLNNPSTTDSLFAGIYGLVHGPGGVFVSRYLVSEQNKESKEDNIVDPELLYAATRCVYHGKIPLQEKGVRLEKGDNFYYIQLSRPLLPPQDQAVSVDDIKLQADLYTYIFDNIKQKVAGKDYKAVAIEIGDSTPSFLTARFENLPHPTREKLLKGKEHINEPGRESLLLTREDFEDLTINPQEAFVQAVNTLGDSRISHFFDLAKQATSKEDRDEAKRLLVRSLHQLLRVQVEAHFNMPEIIHGRTNDTYAPTRESFYPISFLRRTDNDFYFVQMYDGTGELRWTPLEKLLQTTQKPIEAILNSHSPYRKAQLAFIMDDILRQTPFEELVREPVTDKEELIRNLADRDIESVPELILETGSLAPSSIYKKVRPVLMSLLMYAAYKSGPQVINNFDAARTDLQPTSSAVVRQYEKPRFPDGVIQPGVDWKIEGLNADGYYVTDTSHIFSDGAWRTNNEVKKKLDLPYTLNSDLLPSAIAEEKFIPLNQIAETTIKIPIKVGTKLGALTILAPDGKTIPYQAFELTDGTVQVDIDRNLINNAPSARIQAYLIPSPDTVHAAERIEPIDVTKLSDKARAENDIAMNPNDNSDKLIRDIVQKTHTYSLNPAGKEKLNEAKTAEDVINVVADLPGCDCEVCNSASVLASSVDTKDPAVNLAFGYIATSKSTAGRGDGFLRSEAAHAFGINDKGEVLDSTPSNIDADPVTQQYVNLLHSTNSESNNVASDNTWEKQQKKIQEDAQTKKTAADGLKVIGALLAATTGAFAVRQASRVLKRVFNTENLSRVSDDIMLGLLNEDELNKTYNFFGWLSHGKTSGSQFPTGKEISDIDKREALNRIRENIDQFKLSQYVENPKAFERLAREHSAVLTEVEAAKLRMFARYLIS